MALRLAVLQPTSLCNLNCRYCYVPNRRDATHMDDATMEAAIRAVVRSRLVDGEVELLWHAGEPLAVGIPFYERAFALVEAHRPAHLAVRHSIQTNGTLINEDWVELFAANHVALGLSLDGPAWLHDRHRRTWGDRDSHARAMRGLRMLQEGGVRPGVLCVLTRDSLDAPDEIYDFFVGAAVRSVGFNVEETENANLRSSLADRPPLGAYRNFIRQLWRRWRAEPGRLEIREFDRTIRALLERRTDSAWTRSPDETIGFRIVTIDRHGDVTTFSPELAGASVDGHGSFVLGNVRSTTLDAMAAGPRYSSLAAEVADGVRACAESCRWFDLCGGGFVSNKLFEHGTFAATETVSCRLHRQALLEVVISELATESRRTAPQGSQTYA